MSYFVLPIPSFKFERIKLPRLGEERARVSAIDYP